MTNPTPNHTIEVEGESVEIPGTEIDAAMQHYGITEDAAVYMFTKTFEAMLKHGDNEALGQASLIAAIVKDTVEGNRWAEEYLASYLRSVLPVWTDIYEKAEARSGDTEDNIMPFMGTSRDMARAVIAVVRLAKKGYSLQQIAQTFTLAMEGMSVEKIAEQIN